MAERTALTASRKEGGTEADEDSANGGVRREAALSEHEEIARPEPSLASAPKAFRADETDDDEATQAGDAE